MNERIVVYGAGTTGRVIARDLNAKGTPALCLVDSNQTKHGLKMEGIDVVAPEVAKLLYPDATWIAAAIVPEYRKEIAAEIERLGVQTMPVWGFLPQRHTPPTPDVAKELMDLVRHDRDSSHFVADQLCLRQNPSSYVQCSPANINEIYFPEWITHRDDEHYVDCGAADGDTVREFKARWPRFAMINALEPDERNFEKLCSSVGGELGQRIYCIPTAVGDVTKETRFTSTGDYSAHLDEKGAETVGCAKLDDMFFDYPLTYIKMDIEGSEPEALWGARRIIKDHKPVLAICAYHEASHFWELPLLIHALQPEYFLFFRRYAEGSFEIVWYAVPPERLR